MSLYPPYLGAGVRIKSIKEDFSEISVEMKLRFWNKNYVGTHFGGSLYSMVDPFFMLMLIETLGRDYIVWDKAAQIKFKRPGRGTVYANFKLDPQKVIDIKNDLEMEPKINIAFDVNILDKEGNVIAEVEKIIHVSKK